MYSSGKRLFAGLVTALLMTASANAAPLYGGNDHRVMDHVKSSPMEQHSVNAAASDHKSKKAYGPASIAGVAMTEVTLETINKLPAPAAGAAHSRLHQTKDYGIRDNLKR